MHWSRTFHVWFQTDKLYEQFTNGISWVFYRKILPRFSHANVFISLLQEKSSVISKLFGRKRKLTRVSINISEAVGTVLDRDGHSSIYDVSVASASLWGSTLKLWTDRSILPNIFTNIINPRLYYNVIIIRSVNKISAKIFRRLRIIIRARARLIIKRTRFSYEHMYVRQ